MDLSHVLSYVLEPQLLRKNLWKTPLQTWWDLKDIAEQDREKSSFLITWNCYTRGLVAKEKHFRGNAQSFKIYANHHAPAYVKFSVHWIFNRDCRKPHYQLQVNVKRKKKKFKHWTNMRVSGWGSSLVRTPGRTMFATLRGGIQSLSPCPGGGIQSLSPLREGPCSPGIQSASDRWGPGNLPGKPGPIAFLNRRWGHWPGHSHLFKSWRKPLLGPREAERVFKNSEVPGLD